MIFSSHLYQLIRWSIICLTFLIVSCSTVQQKVYPLDPPADARIVFVGNTFVERWQFYNYFEPLLYRSFPDRNLTIRNLGWSGDEINYATRPLNFPTQDQLLAEHKADIIFACYGLNEAFKGKDSLSDFKKDLTSFLQHFKEQRYNGHSAPQIILLSPIYHESLGGLLPDPATHNKNVALYTEAMQEVAGTLGIPFINLLTPTKQWASGNDSITINGIHLNDKGYRMVSEVVAKSLALPVTTWSEDQHLMNLKKMIDQKNQQFFYLYRAVNSEYIMGRRKEPWVQPSGGPISYPGELAKLRRIILNMDSLVWAESRTDDPMYFERSFKILNDTALYTPLEKATLKRPSTDQFILPEGFEINLFASEVDFSISNPVKITFDPKGRLWVADMPTYPQYLPGSQPNDKIIILEDTDGDGQADKETIFADSLYVPTSFELGKGGVYVSQPPNIWFLKDVDGDDRADEKEIILHGFGTEDIHHTLDTYTWGPDGALYWHTGTFLHSQVETPYGLQRGDYGITWRFNTERFKLEPYVSYPYANPWGHTFLRNGTEIIADVSTGMNYFAPPLTVATDYPLKRAQMKDFLTSRIKPKTCGTEIISSGQFPDNMQGDILFNTFIGFQGTRQHKIREDGSGIMGVELPPLIQSKDPNFRPVDLQFGPDGALYIVDWYNPIISHGERALRDPLRDHTHGRIWRLTYKGKKLLARQDLTRLTIPELLERLKEHEDRLRYRVRTQLRQSDKNEVLPALEKWIATLDTNDVQYGQNLLEGLWVYQQFNPPNESLLYKLLQSKQESVRTAATRVLWDWRDQIPDAEKKLIALSKDASPKVRLQAVISLSYFKTASSVNALLGVTEYPMDYYLNYALRESLRRLKPVWEDIFLKNKQYLGNDSVKAVYLLKAVTEDIGPKMPDFTKDDPAWRQYEFALISEEEIEKNEDLPALQYFISYQSQSEKLKDTVKLTIPDRQVVELATVPAKMVFDLKEFSVKAGSKVTLLLTNKDGMAHNVVIVKPGSLKRVGEAADAMASTPDGYQRNFVPAMAEVLFSTPLIPAEQQYRLDFTAPAVPGEYPFLCSFPGHWQSMNGVMKVVR